MKLNWTNWIQSEEGKRAANLSTLYPNHKDGEVYLENRLWYAFMAGAAYERGLLPLNGSAQVAVLPEKCTCGDIYADYPRPGEVPSKQQLDSTCPIHGSGIN